MKQRDWIRNTEPLQIPRWLWVGVGLVLWVLGFAWLGTVLG